ncbi:hypothetical protein Ahy_B08g093077 [Arachis hypogaea]|uniref:Beta-galactosidase beta-sandwich domain-containing protein n=1 Tax=Arachis hypogaea TaxID=3818 RepID=A0A444Y598_ARAHY|nr:hypothetical protein Ahy_B08g093077 [Arachis hypogaea]
MKSVTHFPPPSTIAAVGLATADSRRPSSYTHSNRISIPPPQICVDVSDPPLPRSASSRATVAASSSDLLFQLKLLPTCSCGLGDSELQKPGGRKRWRSSSQLFVHIDELDLKIKKYLRGEDASFEDLKDRNLKHQLSVREELYGNATKAAAKTEKVSNKAQPKWGHLKELHRILKSMEESLTNGNVFQIDFGNSVTATVYASDKSSSCFLTNANTTTDATVSFRGRTYVVPAWSSLLPNCQNEEYNKAKVNVQTSVMVKVSNKAEDEPMSLNWTWRAENVDHALLAKVNASESAHELIDQKDAADDASDYLWYITRLQLDQDDLVWSDDMSLRINGSGQRSHWATYGIHNDKFETKLKLQPGKNTISLLRHSLGK